MSTTDRSARPPSADAQGLTRARRSSTCSTSPPSSRRPSARVARSSGCSGKNIALIFEKDSTRTRCAFEVAAYDQGAHVTFIGPSRLAHGPQGDGQGHRPGARPHV